MNVKISIKQFEFVGFMTKNASRRLGCTDGEDSIRKHPFFKGKHSKSQLRLRV